MTDNLFFIDEDEVLAHHGVKGMKWGVRKQRAASGGAGSTKKRKGLSRKQKAAIAGVLGTAAAAGAGYYLHKSGKGKQLAGLAKKGGASAKTAASKLKATKAGHAARSAGLRAKQGAWKVGNKARRAATGGVSGAKSAAGMAARSAKSKVGAAAKSTASVKTPGKALQVAPRGVGYRKLYTTGTRVKAAGGKKGGRSRKRRR